MGVMAITLYFILLFGWMLFVLIFLRPRYGAAGGWLIPLGYSIIEFGYALYALVFYDLFNSVLFATLGVFFLWRTFKDKPPRDKGKLRKAIGAKARAIRDKMVAAMPKPRPLVNPA